MDLLSPILPLQLGQFQALGDHSRARERENERGNVHFDRSARKQHSQRQLILNKPLGDPPRHKTHQGQSSGNRSSLKVLGLARLVLGDISHSDIEPSESRQATEHENSQQNGIHSGLGSNGKGNGCRSHSKGNEVSQRVQFLAHERRLLAPPSNSAVKHVEKEAQGHAPHGSDNVLGVLGLVEPHALDNGHEAAEAVEHGDVVGHVQLADHGKVVVVLGELDNVLFVGGLGLGAWAEKRASSADFGHVGGCNGLVKLGIDGCQKDVLCVMESMKIR